MNFRHRLRATIPPRHKPRECMYRPADLQKKKMRACANPHNKKSKWSSGILVTPHVVHIPSAVGFWHGPVQPPAKLRNTESALGTHEGSSFWRELQNISSGTCPRSRRTHYSLLQRSNLGGTCSCHTFNRANQKDETIIQLRSVHPNTKNFIQTGRHTSNDST